MLWLYPFLKLMNDTDFLCSPFSLGLQFMCYVLRIRLQLCRSFVVRLRLKFVVLNSEPRTLGVEEVNGSLTQVKIKCYIKKKSFGQYWVFKPDSVR